MGKENDLSVFIKIKHVLYYLFLCRLFPFESIRETRENKTHGKISHSTVYGIVCSDYNQHSKLIPPPVLEVIRIEDL